jgi:hypothetical protein
VSRWKCPRSMPHLRALAGPRPFRQIEVLIAGAMRRDDYTAKRDQNGPDRRTGPRRVLHSSATLGPSPMTFTSRGPCSLSCFQYVCRWGKENWMSLSSNARKISKFNFSPYALKSQ